MSLIRRITIQVTPLCVHFELTGNGMPAESNWRLLIENIVRLEKARVELEFTLSGDRDKLVRQCRRGDYDCESASGWHNRLAHHSRQENKNWTMMIETCLPVLAEWIKQNHGPGVKKRKRRGPCGASGQCDVAANYAHPPYRRLDFDPVKSGTIDRSKEQVTTLRCEVSISHSCGRSMSEALVVVRIPNMPCENSTRLDKFDSGSMLLLKSCKNGGKEKSLFSVQNLDG